MVFTLGKLCREIHITIICINFLVPAGVFYAVYLDCIYRLLAECEVRTASYGPSFFLPFMAKARSACMGDEKKEGKNEDP